MFITRIIFPTVVACAVCQAEPALRQSVNFNSGWRYLAGDHPGAEQAGYDDSGWQAIGLPHSFSTPYFMAKDFYTGYGWYRKSFELSAEMKGKHVSLEFEAAFQDAEIFLNGKKAGSHQGGYNGFPIDITDHLQPGKNVVAVRLNNLWKPGLAPRAGEHVFSGGLYRNLRLVTTDALHVTWCGTFVTTPKVSASSATVNVKTEVTNQRTEAVSAELRTAIFDPHGKPVTRISNKLPIAAGATVIFDQNPPAVVNPNLWDIGKPHLYRAVSQLYVGDQVVDRYETSFGIRSIEWIKDKGFFLNGRHVYLRGANVHQDQAGWGDAVTDSGHRRDVEMMKEAGFNFLRGSHYPPAPAKVRACDELGMPYWAENCFWGIGGAPKEGGWSSSAYPIREEDEKPFTDSLRESLRAMIRIHRNSPSIIAWSMSNEPFFSEKQVMPKVSKLLKELVEYSHELDPTRPAAVGGSQRPIDSSRIDLIGDIASYNGDGATQPAFQNPGVASVVSEYGSVTSDRPGKYDPGWGGSLEKQVVNGFPTQFSWRAGEAVWCGYDHGSIAGSALGKMGIVDYFRIPKRAWFWYRKEYGGVNPPEWPKEGTPAALTLSASKTDGILTDGTDDAQLTLTVTDAKGTPLSNSPPVDLTITSGPGEFPTGPSIRFEEKSDIRIQDGQAAISIRAWNSGSTVVTASSPGLESATITLKFTGGEPYVEGTTEKAAARPYVRFDPKNQKKTESVFGPNNPTFASSSATGAASGLAADSDPKTAWKPDPTDTNPSITLDTEKGLAISRVQLTFPAGATPEFRVETSDDQSNWKTLPGTTDIAAPAGTKGRYVRVSFGKSADAALAEIRVTGSVLD